MKKHSPQPTDTSAEKIDESLMLLSEKLAKNAHEAWALERMQNGWVFGKEKSNERKLHPFPINYEDLPKSEKEHYRNTSLETLKLILKLGYKVQPSKKIGLLKSRENELLAIQEQIKNRSLSSADLLVIWQSHDALLWSLAPELYYEPAGFHGSACCPGAEAQG
jgi:hypothetical protein